MSFSAIVLTEESQRKLKDTFKDKIPENFVYQAAGGPTCHHVTIAMGAWIPENNPSLSLGQKVKIRILSFGANEKVAAVKIDCPEAPDLKTETAFPHITIAVKPGTSPKEAASITNFQEVGEIYLEGTVDGKPASIKAAPDPAQQKALFENGKKTIAGRIMSLSKNVASSEQKQRLKDAVLAADSVDAVKNVLSELRSELIIGILAKVPGFQPISKREALLI